MINAKTLVIHPEDPTTRFLTAVYESIPYKTVLSGGVTVNTLMKLVDQHERILILGHGTPEGLLFVPDFFLDYYQPYIIDRSLVSLLKNKAENLYIWCYARYFVERHQLQGFYSEMFISELGESIACGLREATEEEVEQSNSTFSRLVGEKINEGKHAIWQHVKDHYTRLNPGSAITSYNDQRIFVR